MPHDIRVRERKAGLHNNANAAKIIKIARQCDWYKLNTNLAAVESLRVIGRVVSKMRMFQSDRANIIVAIREEKSKFGYEK